MNSIYIVDSQMAVGHLLSESLAARDFAVVGTSDTMAKALKQILELEPSLVVMEMNLPDGLGSSLIEPVRVALPDTRFLVFSDNKDGASIKACLKAGAHGFVEKSVDFNVFLNAIKLVKGGGCFFGFNITEVLRSKVRPTELPDKLTAREVEVLRLIADGKSNKQIASRLAISVKTVDNHRCSLMRKLDLHNVAAITRYAIEHRIVPVKFAR